MSIHGIMQNFNNIHELAGIANAEDMRVVITDLVAPYVTDVRDTRGFKETPLKPAYKLEYHTLMKETSVGIMADHVAFDAKGVARKTKGVEILKGTMPNIVAHRAIDKNDYLKIMEALNDAMLANPEVYDAVAEETLIVTEMQGVVSELVRSMLNEHNNRVTYMRGQAVSKGAYSINVQNNPNEFSIPTFDFKVPAANRTALTGADAFWTDATRATANADAKVLEKLQGLVDAAIKTKRIKKGELVMEVEYWTLMDTVRHPSIRLSVGTALNPIWAASTKITNAEIIASTYGMSDEELIAFVEAKLGVKFEVSDAIVAVQKFNDVDGVFEDETMSAFEPNTFVVRRKGDIGEIHCASQISVGAGEGSNGLHVRLNDGKIMLKYKANSDSEAQQWDTQEITLLVPTDVKNMFYLTVV